MLLALVYFSVRVQLRIFYHGFTYRNDILIFHASYLSAIFFILIKDLAFHKYGNITPYTITYWTVDNLTMFDSGRYTNISSHLSDFDLTFVKSKATIYPHDYSHSAYTYLLWLQYKLRFAAITLIIHEVIKYHGRFSNNFCN